eukprot:CAMPEP_0203992558 /NCGR_PEP_ID=MMETSP0360-20130528/10166_1 /ASSEMBLY_ACC=CAM_ASM_000342 /TAXON_ID=268821 /ORGANISM="Scrippsiella Hangoei, Strain SHTV-5" /LENGTH=60 /DNA_ID=CAMNT_0050932881 /DNA_START=1 /DNA_END=179 /DNA_ORIENTATION=+
MARVARPKSGGGAAAGSVAAGLKDTLKNAFKVHERKVQEQRAILQQALLKRQQALGALGA